MGILVTYNDVEYTIPTGGQVNWASLTQYLVALASGAVSITIGDPANGLTFVDGVLSLGLATNSTPGALSITTQNIAGIKTFSSAITSSVANGIAFTSTDTGSIHGFAFRPPAGTSSLNLVGNTSTGLEPGLFTRLAAYPALSNASSRLVSIGDNFGSDGSGYVEKAYFNHRGALSLLVATGNNAVNLLNGARLNLSTSDASAYLYRSATDTIRTPGNFTVDGTFTAPGIGTVNTLSIVTANGVSGSVATATTTPAITLTLGAITPTSVAASGTVTGSNLSNTNSGDVTIASFGSSPTANGASISGQAITLQPADATNPGLVSTGTQTLAGAKTLSSGLSITVASGSNSINLLDGARLNLSTGDASAYLYRSASNTIRTPGSFTVDGTFTVNGAATSGANSGDVTLGTFGSSPDAKGATISGQVVTLQPADATHPGLVTTGAQNIAGAKTFSGAITSTIASGSDAIVMVAGSKINSGDIWHYVGTTGEPAFSNSWANFGSSYQNLRFKYLPHGFVRLEGVLLSPVTPTLSLFTLPAAYRPATMVYCIISHGVAVNPGTIEIHTDGTMIVYGVTNNQGVTIMLDFALD